MTQPADKPPEKPTVPMSQAEIFNARFDKLEAVMLGRFDKTDANIDLVANDLSVVKEQQRLDGNRINELEKRADTNSMRARQPSAADLETAAALVKSDAAREALAKQVADHTTMLDALDKKTDAQTAILTRLDKVASNPLVKDALKAIVAGLVYYLASKGVHLQ